jgi:hypothetical protein
MRHRGPAILVLACASAVAQADELTAYAGQLFGQALTQPALADGSYPRLADGLTYGGRYDHSLAPGWGVELAAEQTLTRAEAHWQPGVSRLRLRAADLDVTWNFMSGPAVVGYTLMGAGIARAHLDPDLLLAGVPAPVAGRVTATANLGIGARAYATSHLLFRAEVRYRFLGHLVSPGGRTMSTFETTAGLGWKF